MLIRRTVPEFTTASQPLSLTPTTRWRRRSRLLKKRSRFLQPSGHSPLVFLTLPSLTSLLLEVADTTVTVILAPVPTCNPNGPEAPPGLLPVWSQRRS